MQVRICQVEHIIEYYRYLVFKTQDYSILLKTMQDYMVLGGYYD